MVLATREQEGLIGSSIALNYVDRSQSLMCVLLCNLTESVVYVTFWVMSDKAIYLC